MELVQEIGTTGAAVCAHNEPQITLEYEGVTITILGTAHVSRTSADTVRCMVNSGDYAQFSQDFSPILQEALPEQSFEDLRQRLKKTSGKWLTVDALEELPDPPYVTFELSTSFEKEPVRVLVWYPVGSDLMQGLWLDSDNLQAYQADED